MDDRAGAFGVLGVFLVLLGAGVVLDADLVWTGTAVMGAGVGCLVAAGR